jgi:hypothetical protein
MADVETRSGNRVVILVFGAIVLIAGVMGTVLGSIRPDDLDPTLFFLIDLPPTPLGVALYGMATVGVGLGVFIGLVMYVSNRFEDA